jgi:hypothetical protein
MCRYLAGWWWFARSATAVVLAHAVSFHSSTAVAVAMAPGTPFRLPVCELRSAFSPPGCRVSGFHLATGQPGL